MASRKAAIEALTGAPAGRVLSCEILAFGVPTSFNKAEGNINGARYRKRLGNPAQSETPGMLGNSTRENREAPSTPGHLRAGEGGRYDEA